METPGTANQTQVMPLRQSVTLQAAIFGLVLIAVLWMAPASIWQSTKSLYIALEFIAALLALVVALGGIVRYIALEQRLVLLFALGFLGAGIADMLNASLSLQVLSTGHGSNPGTWTAGRLIHGLLLLASLVVGRYAPRARRVKTELLIVLIGTLLVTGGIIALFSQYSSRVLIARLPSVRIVAGWALILLFFWSAWGYLQLSMSRRSSFLDWAGASAVMFGVAQVYSALFSEWAEGNVILPNGLKLLGYVVALTGLYMENLSLFKETEQQRDALRESQERLQGILRSLNDSVWSVAVPSYDMVFASPATETIYGRPLKQFYENADFWKEMIHPDDRARIERETDAILDKGSYSLEFRILRPDGEVRWILDRAQVVHDGNGKPVRLDGIATDITERKRAEEQLHRAYEQIHAQNHDLERTNQQLAVLLDGSRRIAEMRDVDALVRTILEKATEIIPQAETGMILLYDPHHERLIPRATLGFSLESVLGMRIRAGESFLGRVYSTGDPFVCHSSEDLAAEQASLDEANRRRFEQALEDKGPIQATICTPLVEHGDSIGVMLLNTHSPNTPFTDYQINFFQALCNHAATGIRNTQLYNEVQQYANQLTLKNRELESFVYTASHDLRSPLVSLHGLMAMFGKTIKDKLDDRGRRYMRRLDANVSQMEELIDGLLELARVGRSEAKVEAVQVNALLDQLVEQLRPQLEKNDIRLVVQPDMPVIYAPAVQMRQIFGNLISNAVKFMGESEQREIEVGGEEREGIAHFFVRDTGIGIDPTYHDKVFVIFQRLQELEEVKGTGVGLAIVKKIIENLGGAILVESEKGKGATFRFTIPIVEPAEADEQGNAAVAASS